MPLEFTFTEEQELFRKTVRELMAKYVAPKKKELLEARMLTPDVHKALTGAGLSGLLIPTEYGGSASDYVTFIIAVEELTEGTQQVSRVCQCGMGPHALAYYRYTAPRN